ncbi:1,6-anhydro-N-acetylmuramyl-L-alanine amidase AmpD [Aliiglaciecola sp. LCG003]|uniref:1,6-anhydro-N-acetylmuramyl-L-alanine amidase AmpD n=1 Tax=Aliiglaciecola sp. LCG003 TaxID=3053655 RepID=UPI0025738EAF|nr:1,6-anhydro-N-acetylmuramyl-L-alanine amidase AmpD [Aliiglaciecola sp. LCG003]WJG10204.1 1,6-anhydro-N-acetylmuramyl-L-alanine amidase AmpD [Aliiglaciecola sp. LCG003]
MQILHGWLEHGNRSDCEHFDQRPKTNGSYDINLLVIHNISLPPGQFGSDHILDFFAGKLNPQQHDFFKHIYQMRVSSHLLIRRDGKVVQFVSFLDRAWHAGLSSFQGRTRCNDFSIGIELEGTDNSPYSNEQYIALAKVSQTIMHHYPDITLGRIVGHNDIAPQRKTDPGVAFDWCRFRQSIC